MMASCRMWRRVAIWVVVGLTYLAIFVKWQLNETSPSVEIIVERPNEEDAGKSGEHHEKRENDAVPKYVKADVERSTIYDERREKMIQACRENRYNGRTLNAASTDNFSIDRKNGIVYCDIPKVASTFWKRVLQIASGKRQKNDVFDIPARSTHAGLLETFQKKGFDEIHQVLSISTKFMFVREPYSRLVSGYIDKIFTPRPAYRGLRNEIKNFGIRGNKTKVVSDCALDITFTQFVVFLVGKIAENTWRNGHFVPMYDMCRPCEVQFDIIGKMETFNEDATYIFKKNGFPASIQLDDQRNDLDSITDIVDSTFAEKEGMEKCLPFGKALEYVWKKAVIRGILSKEESMPKRFIDQSNFSREDFKKAMVDAYHRSSKNPDRMNNRKEALVEAIRSVPKDILQKYRKLFRPDFEIFGYDMEEPQIFQVRQPKPFYFV
ncbi:carbohydrate sulfotransferase 14-like [Liolophura sinensis]|uniref:carbohydrate sulfotransferase 14-like n=1 Tax=Liolophura sinensis TaxID=3198878 RepID=UPI0031590866